MEYLAKIVGEENRKLNYISILPIRLKLSFDEEQQVNFLQSFEQNIASYIEGSRAEKALTKLLGKSSQTIENLSLKKEKIKLTPQLIARFEKERINGKKITQKSIARITGYCERTIRYRKKQNNKPLQKRGRKRIMNEDVRAFLYLDFLADSTKSQKERAKDIGVSQQVISYNLKKDIDFTRKKATKRYSGLDMEEVKQFLKENYGLYSSPNCLATDEFNTHSGMAPQYAWSREATISCKLIKNEKKKIKDEKTGKERIKKGTDTTDFYDFLENIELPASEEYYLLLDNSPIHDPPNRRPSKILKKAGLLSMEELAKQKNITLVYLPKYAPQMNPAELCINFVKHYIETNRPRTEEKLKEVIKKAIYFLNHIIRYGKIARRQREDYKLDRNSAALVKYETCDKPITVNEKEYKEN
ncbi:6082_t:CDS:2 [Funneliformis geosporum]|nr:6082_t:CDS:2 [Funneliformis geosporum]